MTSFANIIIHIICDGIEINAEKNISDPDLEVLIHFFVQRKVRGGGESTHERKQIWEILFTELKARRPSYKDIDLSCK